MKHKIIYGILVVIVLILLIDQGARFLQQPNRVEPVGEANFLLTTKWHQIHDYAKFIPNDDDAGCWAVAIGQIAHYHRISPTGFIEYKTSGNQKISIDLGSYDFDHRLFVESLEADTPAKSKEQVAKYLYFIATVLYTDFGSHGYLEHETFVSRLEQHLNCAVEFLEYKKDTFLNRSDQIQSRVKTEIDATRPLMFYFDNGDDWGHAAVIDGYVKSNDAFQVHLNMGWGGRHDGWYDLFHRIMGVRDDLQNRFLITINPQTRVENQTTKRLKTR